MTGNRRRFARLGLVALGVGLPSAVYAGLAIALKALGWWSSWAYIAVTPVALAIGWGTVWLLAKPFRRDGDDT